MLTAPALPPRPLARRLAPVASVLRAPVRADTWRRTAYAVVALPVALASVPLSLDSQSGEKTYWSCSTDKPSWANRFSTAVQHRDH
jgi:hypothetical protein